MNPKAIASIILSVLLVASSGPFYMGTTIFASAQAHFFPDATKLQMETPNSTIYAPNSEIALRFSVENDVGTSFYYYVCPGNEAFLYSLDDDQNVTVNPNITSQSVVTVTSHNGGPTQHEVIQYLLTLNLQGLPEGQHKIIVYVLIGLSSPLPCPPSYVAFEPLYFTVSAPPTILVTSPQNITYATQNIPVNFLTNEHVTQTTYSLDGQENVTVIGNTTLSGLPIGPHNITCYATDGLGNWAAPQTVYFEVANSQSSVAKSFHLEPTYFLIAAAGLAAVAAGACLFYFKARKRPCK